MARIGKIVSPYGRPKVEGKLIVPPYRSVRDGQHGVLEVFSDGIHAWRWFKPDNGEDYPLPLRTMSDKDQRRWEKAVEDAHSL
ncbi:MAG: hypothetical protein OXG98_03470 [Gemmatimonadetes bacterium]|nr:hypothetical protein [Gemmatimonadota bacterium]